MAFSSDEEEESRYNEGQPGEYDDATGAEEEDSFGSPRSRSSSPSSPRRHYGGGRRGRRGSAAVDDGRKQAPTAAVHLPLATASAPTTSSLTTCKSLKAIKPKFKADLPANLTQAPESVLAIKSKKGGSGALKDVEAAMGELGKRYKDLQAEYEGREESWAQKLGLALADVKALLQYANEQEKRDKKNTKKYESVMTKLSATTDKLATSTAKTNEFKQKNRALTQEIQSLKRQNRELTQESKRNRNKRSSSEIDPLAHQQLKHNQKMELEMLKIDQKNQNDMMKDAQKEHEKVKKQMMVKNNLHGLTANGVISNGVLNRGALMTTVSPTRLSFHLSTRSNVVHRRA